MLTNFCGLFIRLSYIQKRSKIFLREKICGKNVVEAIKIFKKYFKMFQNISYPIKKQNA